MANKLVAIFLSCLVVAAAMYVPAAAQAAGTSDDDFRSCFNNCHSGCTTGGSGNTFCEMKCDADCVAKEAAAKLNLLRP
ncbi:hypothetical protein SLEP1_g1068 [Rubroshorea leprosula]|uniref:Uncharacterized protein n=1 Tax=Rubroshorea leprosula TaxID=152421 RepID=A0AAV5HM33_9ROSI|nr:hypothetical protein SLEP1_g1068 [Rubroshorea leprosula]